MSGFPKNGNISAAPVDRLCYNCNGDGWVTVPVPLARRSKVEPSGARAYPNRLECPVCKGAGIKEAMFDGNQGRLFA